MFPCLLQPSRLQAGDSHPVTLVQTGTRGQVLGNLTSALWGLGIDVGDSLLMNYLCPKDVSLLVPLFATHAIQQGHSVQWIQWSSGCYTLCSLIQETFRRNSLGTFECKGTVV